LSGDSQRLLKLQLADVSRLEEIVDRDAMTEVCRSFHALFGISVRVFSREGTLVADVHTEQAICQYVNTLAMGKVACIRLVSTVKQIDPEEGIVVHPCFTGAVYRIVPIDYQGRRVGRFIVGPYLPAETKEVPRSLLVVDPGIDHERASRDLAGLPRVRGETADRIASHLRGILDLLLFSNHRAFLTSEMHIASVRESFRELAEKNSRLEAAYEKLQELDKLKSNFLATVSHELRTPLTSIIGYSEMLESGIAGELAGEQLEFIQIIREKGEHLLELITSLLDLGKLEQGPLKLDRMPIDVSSLLEDVLKTFHPKATKKALSLTATTADNARTFSLDVIRMRQVLFNLVENSVKFTPDGGSVVLGARLVEILDDSSDAGAVLMAETVPALELTIEDTGLGMAAEELPKIFDAFYQVDGGSTRQFGGAGLGLAIVKRIIDSHEGKITVTSEVGRGTRFTITIPEPA